MGRKVGSAVVGEPNWVNRTIFVGDNLGVLRGMNSASVDLVYLDPPFNSNRSYSAPVGSEAAGASFKDAWTLSDMDEAWLGIIAEQHPAVYSVCQMAELSHSKGMKSYLAFMSVRIMELHRLLKDIGSLWLHCDDSAGAYLTIILDAIFGQHNRGDIVTWKRQSANNASKRSLGRICDTLLRYTKEAKQATWNIPRSERSLAEMKEYRKDANGRLYKTENLTAPSRTPTRMFEWRGTTPSRAWIYDQEKLEQLYAEGRIATNADGSPLLRGYIKYLDEIPKPKAQNIWLDINRVGNTAKERTGFPTQKPVKLLERIIKASSNEGDVVLDPFAGCATTCEASERLGRQWVGIDLSPKAYDLVRMRLQRASDEGALFKGGKLPDVITRSDIPKRSDVGEPVEYSTVKHKLFGVQDGRCNGCKHEFPFWNFEIDHIVARNKGGGDNEENLQLLCGHCNRVKGTKTQEELIVRLKEMGVIT